MKILLIEDDSATAQSVLLMLQTQQFSVDLTCLGREGMSLAKSGAYDLILLDLDLPDMSGYEVLRLLRVAGINTPTLILSGFTGIKDKVKGLQLGADDYMTKPFHMNELLARIHAIAGRAKREFQSVVQVGDLVINLDQRTARVAGSLLHFTPKEYEILALLAMRRGMIATKEMIFAHLYGGIDEPGLKVIDVFLSKLRKKLADASDGKDYIETVWSQGYRLQDPNKVILPNKQAQHSM
jgi:two-component system cell cycle response regulator CtrA